MTFSLESSAFPDGGEIPQEHSCEGKEISPPLEWHGVPDDTRSLVLIVDDPDAPDPEAPRMIWVHWVLYNIPPDVRYLPAGDRLETLSVETAEGLNDWKQLGYRGPCPPTSRHRYFHKLYALDVVLEELDKPTKAAVEMAITGHVIAETQLVGTYQKSSAG